MYEFFHAVTQYIQEIKNVVRKRGPSKAALYTIVVGH